MTETAQGVEARLRALAARFEERFARELEARRDVPETLAEAMAHAALGGGKRLRPALVLSAARVFGEDERAAWAGALAIECIHVYSLVHDDLPCMDDDDLRRGRPTVHKVWDEATATLAGDALQALAFEFLARAEGVSAERALQAVRLLAAASGDAGMVGGQQRDLDAEGQGAPTLATVRAIHEQKTMALIQAALELGAVLGGASAEQQALLARYGACAGLAFQIVDDCLDVTASSEELGKTAGKDVDAGKATWPACVGLQASREEAERLLAEAHACLEQVSGDRDALAFLHGLADFVAQRRS